MTHAPFTKRAGFALMEVLMTIGIIGIISSFSVPVYRRYQVRNELGISTSLITQGVDRARLLAESGYQDSDWGFSMEHGVLFKGESYDTRDPAYDESYPIPDGIEQSGTTEVWFKQSTGEPNAPGAVILLTGDDGEKRTVELQLNNVGSPVNTADFVQICHGPNTPAPTVMYVSDAQLATYLAAGDTIGVCPAVASSSSSSTATSVASSTSSTASSAPASSSVASSSSSAAGGGGSALTTKGLYLLQTTGAGTLSVSGNGHLTVSSNGAVYVNSANSTPVSLTSNGIMTASHYYIAGSPGTTVGSNAHIYGTVHSGSPAVADPLGSLAMPTPAANQLSAVTVTGNAQVTLSPNTYASITVSGNGKLTLSPGFYYITGALNVSGNGRLTGNGVTIFTANGPVSLAGNGAITLSPQTTGTYAGLTLFQSRAASTTVSLSGNGSMSISGAMYAANAPFVLSGNGASNIVGSLVIGKSLNLSGNAQFNVQ